MKRSPLKRRSAKKKANDIEFAAVREVVLERDRGCRLPMRHRCIGDLHVHHITRRSQGGTNDPWNLVALCAWAHLWVHEHPAQATEMGMLRRHQERNEE